jgi:predicted nucleic acid-binding protein
MTEDKNWFDWSASMLEKCANQHELFINPIIYSEVSIGFKKIEELEVVLPQSTFKRLPLPWEAAFLAGKAFLHYRQLGGHRTLPLPDFFIGAHAMVENLHLLTRDPKRFKHYYPKIKIISP